ncbi:hypothetical protein K443DRAFT_115250, partial [Laccaria amethystina LaAM-08-1]
LTTYPSPSSLSVCKLPFAVTPSAPLPNPQVHERLPLRTVPHIISPSNTNYVKYFIPHLLQK